MREESAMFKKKETYSNIKQINIRLNTDNYYDLEIWEKLTKELEDCYGSKNERLKMILYCGLTGETFYTNIRNLEEIADKAVDKKDFEQRFDEFREYIQYMVREEIRRAIEKEKSGAGNGTS